MASDSSRSKEQKRIRRIIILSLTLALFGGFFIAKSLTDSASLKGKALSQEPSAVALGSALNPALREEEIISSVRSIIKQLKQQARADATTTGSTGVDFSLVKKITPSAQRGSQQEPSVAGAQVTANKSTTGSTEASIGSGVQSTPSPSSPPAQFAISGVPHLVIDGIELNAYIRDDRKYVSIDTASRNIGTAPTTGNTPLKVFLTDVEGNSTLLGEQIIGIAQPGSRQSTQSTFSCPQSGDTEICVVVPSEFSITSNNADGSKVCKRITVPPLYPSSPAPASTPPADCRCT